MDAAATDGAESAFDMAMVVNGVLMILGGIVAGFGLRNPKRAEEQIARAGRSSRRMRPQRRGQARRAPARTRGGRGAGVGLSLFLYGPR